MFRFAISLVFLLVAAASLANSPEGLDSDLLVEAIVADCQQSVPNKKFRTPGGITYDYLCTDNIAHRIRRTDESSRERQTFELLPSVFDGRWLLRPTVTGNGPCGAGGKAHHLSAQIGWGELNANCSGGRLEGKFVYRVGESTEEEGTFHQGVLDGDYVQYQFSPIGKHRPERREAHRSRYRLGALNGTTRDIGTNGVVEETVFRGGVLQVPVHNEKVPKGQNEEDPDGALFLEDARQVALACPPPAPAPPFTGEGDRWDYRCDGDRADGPVHYYNGGFLRFDLQMRSGRLDGPFRSYTQGVLQTEGTFHLGKPNGVFKRYDQGVLVAEKKFSDGKPDHKTVLHRASVSGELRQIRAGTLAEMRLACNAGQLPICLRAGEAVRAAGYPVAAESFFTQACSLESGIGCARSADDAYHHFDFARATEAIKKARHLLAEDDLVRWLSEQFHLERTAARGGLINILLPGCRDIGPPPCNRLGAQKTNREGVHQRETLRRIRAAKTKRAIALDVEKLATARLPELWRCREEARVRVAIFRCTWPSSLEWRARGSSNGLTEGAGCLTAGLSSERALDAVTVIAEHETLAKLSVLFPESRPVDLWRKATVIGCDESQTPSRPVLVLD